MLVFFHAHLRVHTHLHNLLNLFRCLLLLVEISCLICGMKAVVTHLVCVCGYDACVEIIDHLCRKQQPNMSCYHFLGINFDSPLFRADDKLGVYEGEKMAASWQLEWFSLIATPFMSVHVTNIV